MTARGLWAGVSGHEGFVDLPSYPIAAPERSPVFDCDWSYQRARRSIYPYALNDNLPSQESEKKRWKALFLENEYLKVCVLPEIGGRLFYAIDKTNGYDIFYRQDAIKPANVGMNGAWISGGVEWNVFHHHRISTQMPCNYRLVKNGDGSATIWLGETERRHRMEWAIGITLRPGSSCMEIDGRLVNCTEDSNSMLFWANVATHSNPDYQIIFPQNTEFAAYHAKSSICHWPICREPFTNVDAYTNNVDVSWWKNHTVGNSLFAWELPENFIGGYDHGRDAGTMLVGNRHIIRGGKFWSWGPNSGWPTKILTDARGHYVELMVGAYTDSQPDYNWSAPGETKVFKQYWYGVRNLKGIKMGDETYALNMEKTAPDRLFLAANATRKVEKVEVKVERAAGEAKKVVYKETVDLAPDRPWSETIDVPANVDETAYTMTVGSISYTPVKHDLSKPCPAEVKTPKRPKDIESTEECYYVGLRAEQFHQPYVNANDYYEEVIRRDPLDVRANTRLGVYYRKHWNLEKAEKHLRAALVRQTKDYTRVKDGEAMYNLGLVLAEKGDPEGAIDCLYRAVWTYEYNSAANLKLARIYAAKGDWKMALDRADEAIAYNAHNLDAKCLKAMVGYNANRTKGFVQQTNALLGVAKDVLAFDPLNAQALYLSSHQADFEAFMRDDPESYVELALKMSADGFPKTARDILKMIDAKVTYPAVKLHLGKIDEFLKMDLVDWRPFRRETKDLLEKLVAEHPESAQAWYALGNVYGNVDTSKAMAAWAKSIEQSEQSNNRTILSYALRNLGYGHWKWTKDHAKSLGFYSRAIAAKPDEAFFFEEFDHVAEEAKLPVSERYQMLKSHHETVEKRAGALTAEIVTGVACKDYDRILEILRTKYIPTFEGAANMHDIYVDALLGKAAELEKSGDMRGALELYAETESYPANQQVFVEFTKRRPRDAQVWYRMGLAHGKLGDEAKAKAFFEKSAGVDTLRTDYCYEKALSLFKLGRTDEAKAIGGAMVKRGSVRLDDYVDFFDYEGNHYGSTLDRKNAAAAETLRLGRLLLGDGDCREPTGASSFDVDLPHPRTGKTVSASDYGFSPTNDFNAAAVNRAVEAARREGADGVRLAPGVYNCFDVPYGIQLTNLTDFVLDGRGAVLVFRRPAEFVNRPQSDLVHERASILVKDCRRTLVKDLKMDWDWERDPLASFAVCTDVHLDETADGASYVDLLFPDYVRHPAFGQDVPVLLITAMEPSCTRFAQGGRNWHFGGAEGVFGSRNAWLGENRLRVWPAVRQEGKPYFQPAAFLLSPERNRDCVRDMRVGGHYRLMHRYYGKNGINLVSNLHLTLKDVIIWSCFGMGIVIDGKQAYTKLDGVRIEPRTDAAVRRPVSSSSDAIHVARSSGHIILTNVCVRLNENNRHQ